MLTTYIVAYDITDPKRLRQVHKTCRNYGDRLQYSVFECDLNPTDKIEFEKKLEAVINTKTDQIIFIHLGPTGTRGERKITSLGAPYTPKFDAPCYVF